MVKTAVVAACAVLAGCRLWAAGDDPAGRALMNNAQAVLAAANQYIRANNGRAPPDLQALVPQYLATLPAEPALNYSPQRGTLIYNYWTTWPINSTSACEAKLGDSGFHCAVYN